VRELREELDVEVLGAESLIRYPYEYPDKIRWLDLWLVTSWAREPRGLDGQALRWVDIAKLGRRRPCSRPTGRWSRRSRIGCR
jgi:8-oxo-dGTP diphosphatase